MKKRVKVLIMVFNVFIYSLVKKKFKVNMLKGSLIMVGYGKICYRVIFILNWKIYFIVGFLWGNFII